LINNTKFSKLDLALRGLNVNEKYTAYISIPFVKFVLATFRKDPLFLASQGVIRRKERVSVSDLFRFWGYVGALSVNSIGQVLRSDLALGRSLTTPALLTFQR